MCNELSSRWAKRLSVTVLAFLVGLLSAVPAAAHVSKIQITSVTDFAGSISFGNVGPYVKIKGKLTYAVDPDNVFNRQIVDLKYAKTGQLRQDLSVVHPYNTGKGYVEEIVGGDARNAKGEVEFTGDFILLMPKDLSKGNHRLFHEVNNRGRILGLTAFNDTVENNDPTTAADAGNGWLMQQGYSVLWTGWNWDVEAVSASDTAASPLRIFLPILVNPDGSTLSEKINAEITVEAKDGVMFDWLAWGYSRCYLVDPNKMNSAVLTYRPYPDVDSIGPRTVVPKDSWQFGRIYKNKAGREVFDSKDLANAVYITMSPAGPGNPADGTTDSKGNNHPTPGFIKGMIYEVTYDAKNPRVVGLGLAAIRDAISFFHFETQDDYGNPNPLAVRQSNNKIKPDPQFAYVWGESQSGRVINHMIYQGFHVDEKGRMVFEGARPMVPGGGKGAFNYRWAQTTHHPKHIEGNYMVADHFPFNFTKPGKYQIDPYLKGNEKRGDVLAVAKRLHKIPKIMLDNHETEYWTRAASLPHTDVSGEHDALDLTHDWVRFYLINGAQHGPPTPINTRNNIFDRHSDGYVYYQPIQRALLVAMDRWVSQGIQPPPNRVPLLSKGELTTADYHQAHFFSAIPEYDFKDPTTGQPLVFPALRKVASNLKPPRADYGPRFFMPAPRTSEKVPIAYLGLQDNVPPAYFGPPYETRVPFFDTDGNGIGGIRPLELRVPLGTYQGWNPRCDTCGATNFLVPFNVSFWPFPLTEAERRAKNDPRPSIEARYPSQDAYVAKVAAEAADLEKQGFMLPEDVQAAIQRARNMVWPPVPTNLFPFWQMKH